jgi:KaiC/GvpD/RAD55 family RecA-like ATPase
VARPIQIKLGDHWAIVGATGTGKTHFARHLITTIAQATHGYLPIYILDSKCPIARPDKSDFKMFFRKGIGRRHVGNKVPPIIRPQGRDFIQVWTPEEDDLDMYDEWYKQIYQEGQPAVVLTDELSSVTTEAGKGTRYFNILLKQGRGLEISMINLTQSPAYIPQSLLRQAMHVVRFRLNDEYDAKKLTKAMGRVVEEEPEHEHGLWYRNVQVPVKKMPAVYYKNMQEFFGLEQGE